MIINRGRHKLVSEPTACRTPPSNSLVEVESSICKTTLLTVSCLTGSRHKNWVVLASFSPYLYSGTLISLLFLVKDFANSNSRFSHLLHPGEPFTPMIAYFIRSFRRYSSIKFSSPYVLIAFVILYHR